MCIETTELWLHELWSDVLTPVYFFPEEVMKDVKNLSTSETFFPVVSIEFSCWSEAATFVSTSPVTETKLFRHLIWRNLTVKPLKPLCIIPARHLALYWMENKRNYQMIYLFIFFCDFVLKKWKLDLAQRKGLSIILEELSNRWELCFVKNLPTISLLVSIKIKVFVLLLLHLI